MITIKSLEQRIRAQRAEIRDLQKRLADKDAQLAMHDQRHRELHRAYLAMHDQRHRELHRAYLEDFARRVKHEESPVDDEE